MKIRKLTAHGRTEFLTWLSQRSIYDPIPANLINGVAETELMPFDIDIDEQKTFRTRYAFGEYLASLFDKQTQQELLLHVNDNFWNWLTALYFSQFGNKASRSWHYVVTRQGHSGSLAYRHLARTSYEMFWRHGKFSLVMLYPDLSTWGDMSEQLTSRQNVAYNRAYIATANQLYLENEGLKRGAAGRVPPKKKRKQGDKRGRGGAGRLALAVRRLCRTYDTHVLTPDEMIALLPREFAHFNKPPVQP